MKTRTSIRFLTLALALGLALPPASADSRAKVKVQSVVPLKAQAFPLEDVRLLPGPFQRALELDRNYLLAQDPDRLLHNFRINAGLPSSAKPYGGWEEPKCEVRGHYTGHYMSACALMYASTKDDRLRAKGRQIVAGLAECQARIGTGYLSAYPEEFIDRVERGQRVWAPYYTLHKLFAGLLDMYVYCDDEQALEVCKKFGDWAIARNARLTDEQMQGMLSNEHGGMNETLANLHALTGEEKYLAISKRFNHQEVIGPASRRQDRLTGLHANTQIPKFVGTAQQFELSGDKALEEASTFFWNTVVKERSYVIGGHSDGEMFSPKEKLSEAFGPSTTETCNTYNMLKLTRHLFCWDPRADYADYYERALYNHILCSQDPVTGMMCYYVPLRSGSHKEYNTPEDSFWCCTGTGIENHAKYGDSIYFHNGADALYVNLFIPSELDWKAKGIRIRQETRFPEEGATRLKIACKQPTTATLRLRYPSWAGPDFRVRVNGGLQEVSGQPGSYVTLTRAWAQDDTIELAMPMSLRTEGFRDNPRRLALLHGPIVLASEMRAGQHIPAIVSDDAGWLGALKPAAGGVSTFSAPANLFRAPAGGQEFNGVFEPFYRLHGRRSYVVYWDVFSTTEWKAREMEHHAEQARRKEIEARTVDFVAPNQEQNERDHKLDGQSTAAGEFQGRGWRHAESGGWFAYSLKVQQGLPLELWVTYWGSDGGNRVFDILVEGQKVATQRLQNNRPGKFYEEVYALPSDLAQGKERVAVRFQAHPEALAGGVFEVRVMRPKRQLE